MDKTVNVREKLIDALEDLGPESVLWLYDLALGLRPREAKPTSLSARQRGIARCRAALVDLHGSLAAEVMRDREDRL